MRKRKTYFPNVLGVRVDTPTMGWLEQHADQARMPVSTYVRHLIERQAKRDLPQTAEVQDGQD
jgi:hypothetical protein